MTAQKTGFTPPPENLSHEDFASRMAKAIAADRSKNPAGDEGTEPTAKPVGKNPLLNPLFNPMGPTASLIHTVRSVGRGVVNTVDDTIETVISLFSGSQEKAEDSTDFIDDARDAIFGPQSSNGVDRFVEDAAQCTTGFLAAGKIKLFGKALNTLKPIVGGAVRGAITDFVAFDPYKEQLAELVAGSNIPGLKQLGELGSVTEDDGPLVARVKRTASGLVPGVAMDGIIASLRFFRGAAALKTATGEELMAAQKAVAENGKILQDIADGTHTGNQPMIVKQAPDGQYEVTENVDSPEWDALVVKHAQIQESERVIREVESESNTVAAKNRRIREDLGIESVDSDIPEPRPSFDSRWEAEAQAASINEVLASRMAANADLSVDQTRSILDASLTPLDMETPEALVDAFGKMRLNFPLTGASDKTEQLLRAVDAHLSPVFEATQGRPAESLEESIDKAIELAGMISREDAADYLRNVGAVFKNAPANLLWMNNQLMQQGEQVAKWAAIMDQQPWDKVAESEARRILQDYVNLAADVTGSNSGVGRGLNALKARGDEKLAGAIPMKGETGAAEAILHTKAETAPSIIAGMTAVELRNVARLFRQTSQPKVLFNTLATQLSPQNMSLAARGGRGMLEFFYNSILSAPATHAGIFLGTATVSMIEDGVRVMAGVVTANLQMIREGADLITGRLIYAKQSMRGMVDAFKAGHSIIDPRPIYQAIPGIAGEVIRTMGTRPIAAMDEFWRVNNNLAFVRMNSLRIARQDAAQRGLTGSALDRFVSQRVDADVRASIDPATGASRLPAAREHASLPTFSSPLDSGTFGKNLEEMVQNHPWLTPILPFIRTNVNIMDYGFVKGSPLGLLWKTQRDLIAKGGPEAAIAGTRMALGTTVWGAAGLMAFSGGITGNGPTDPKLRKMWLASHQPYSIKVAGKWISYRRLEPFSTALSTMADAATIIRDNSNDESVQHDGWDVFYGLVAGGISAMTNKTYMSGLADFMEVLNSDSPHKAESFVNKLAGTAVPNLAQAFVNDPYLRQTSGMLETLRNRVPGWGQSLPAKYNVFGEPVTLLPSRSHRTISPLPFREAKHMTEDDMLLLDRAFQPPPIVVRFGQMSVNLHNRAYQNTKGGTLTPYERMMEIISESDLRGQIDKIIASDAYNNAGDGTEVFAGGRRFVALRDRIERVQAQAERKMLSEYPQLKLELQGLSRSKRASMRSDAQGQSILDRINQ